MPCHWLEHNRSQLFVQVCVIDANVEPGTLGGAGIDVAQHTFRALVDTGAQATMISKAVAQQLGLRPIGKVSVRGVGGVRQHNNYLFRIGFPVDQSRPDGGFIVNVHILAEDIQGGELDLHGVDFDVLLGMDVLSGCSLAVEGGGGTFSLSY